MTHAIQTNAILMSEPGGNHWRRAPLRFVWQMDAEHRFTVGSEAFTALMGRATAAALGRPWPELAAALAIDPEGQIAHALASRDTWSGLSIAWPAEGRCERLMVELSGLPVFDRERAFRGYRGFGVCRDVAAPAPRGRAGGASTAAPPSAENVVPLRPTGQPIAPALSPVERSAFHELSRKLHERLTGSASPAPLPAAESLRSSLAPAEEAASAAHEVQAAQELPAPPAISFSAADPGAALARAQAEIRALEAMLERKAQDELTAARRHAEKLAAAKSDLLAKISHVIRRPLDAMIGLSQIMAQEKLGPIGNERYRQHLGDILRSGEHVLAVLDDLLDLSKIEAGSPALDCAGVALNAVTQQCVAIVQQQANRERIIIRTSLSHRLPPVLADARSLKHMVLNIIAHSTKSTGAGGQVIVSTTLTDQGEVVLRVHHSGGRPSEAEIARALEPFGPAATGPAPVPAPAGSDGIDPRGGALGLPLAKALAEANGAQFRIRSAPLAGTLTEVAFPPERVLAQDRR